MPNKTRATLFRFLLVVLVGGLIAFAGLPDDVRGHATNSDNLSSGHVDNRSADHHAEVAASLLYCHPALDCFTPEAFFLVPALPASLETGKSKIWLTKIEREGWTPLSDKPPPRNQS